MQSVSTSVICYSDKTESKEEVRTKVLQKAGNSLETKTQHFLLLVNAILVSVNELLWKYFENNFCLFSLCFTTIKNMALPEKRISILKKIIFSKNHYIQKATPFLSTLLYTKTLFSTHMLSGFESRETNVLPFPSHSIARRNKISVVPLPHKTIIFFM